ncbi:MAG: CHAP domain-containing protein [Oscillospiraceae bacterium]|nr:CHAP domain-containing protein [Oscillospiraceae bacterium]
MSKFTPRKTAPSATDKHWIKSTCGGLNECLKISGNSCLPNCVGYAWGRFYELTGEKPRLSTGNAENWYDNTADGYKRSATPKLGAVACWRKGKAFNESDGCGHVAIVEEIKPNGDIVCSNSAYGGTRFYMKTYSKSAGYNDGALTFQGFILPPVDFEEPFAPAKSIDEIANEVIRGDWSNGKEREMRLRNAGYDYDAVQAKVNEILSVPSKTTSIKVGDVVMVKQGAKTYDGGNLADFVYTRPHKVTELVRDRAVIFYDGIVVAAVNVKDLELW